MQLYHIFFRSRLHEKNNKTHPSKSFCVWYEKLPKNMSNNICESRGTIQRGSKYHFNTTIGLHAKIFR